MNKVSLRICLRTALWLCTAAVMVLIFSFSAQSGTSSERTSGGLIESLLRTFYPEFENLAEAAQCRIISSFQGVIRKTAHLGIYAVLGCFTAAALLTHYMKPKTRFLVSTLICVAYAVTDELHQLLVPMRGPGVLDVVIDGTGSVIGIGFVLIVGGKIFKKHIFTSKNGVCR